jgi:hypothetical protein
MGVRNIKENIVNSAYCFVQVYSARSSNELNLIRRRGKKFILSTMIGKFTGTVQYYENRMGYYGPAQEEQIPV